MNPLELQVLFTVFPKIFKAIPHKEQCIRFASATAGTR
jgi:hypothetical protein